MSEKFYISDSAISHTTVLEFEPTHLQLCLSILDRGGRG